MPIWPESLEDFVDVYGKDESAYNSEPAKAACVVLSRSALLDSSFRFWRCGTSFAVSKLWNEPPPASGGFFLP